MTTFDDAAASADAAISHLQDVLRGIGDADLHRAHRAGGWSVAQIVSHINLCTLLWVADLQRLLADGELDFFFREEVGHDVIGYPPPTVELAVAQLESARRSIRTVVPKTLVGDRVVTIPDLGTMTVAEWTPLILGHAAGHVQQAIEVLADRDVIAAGVA